MQVFIIAVYVYINIMKGSKDAASLGEVKGKKKRTERINERKEYI